jgi:hypothetical protein
VTDSQSDGSTRLSYILGVPLAVGAERQWPQMREVVRTRNLIAEVEGNFPELTLEVGRRLHLDGNVIELRNGEAFRVTDYWGEPATTPEWRRPITGRLDMPADGIWKDNDHLAHH